MPTASANHTSQARTAVVGRRFEVAALYGALALISAVVFGTLTIHPF